MRKTTTFTSMAFFLLALFGLVVASAVSANKYGDWSFPVVMEAALPGANSDFNTIFNDGCPIQSPDGLSFYMASNRPGGFGGQDIWIALRSSVDQPWGAPVNAGEPVNSSFDDFCPTPVHGEGLFFVSRRVTVSRSNIVENCGDTSNPNSADIFFTRRTNGGWLTPQNLGCDINSAADEWSPSYFRGEDGQDYLYFASTRPGGHTAGGSDADIYFSVNYGVAQLAPGLNSAFDDHRPNVGSYGREIVFDSTRPGTLGGPDIWTATRADQQSEWGEPVHLPAPFNSAAGETRASLTWDGTQLVFGSNRPGVEGQADIFVSTRQKLPSSRY